MKDLKMTKKILQLYNKSGYEELLNVVELWGELQDPDLRRELDKVLTTSNRQKSDINNTILLIEEIIKGESEDIDLLVIYESIHDDDLIKALKPLLKEYTGKKHTYWK